MGGLAGTEPVPELEGLGFTAFTTTRAFGSLGLGTHEPVREVMARWSAITGFLRARGVNRLASAPQVHGARVLVHSPGWEGWLRADAADGHAAPAAEPTAMAVTVADCVPVFLAHPSGAAAMLHSGWRGTEARIVEAGIDALESMGCSAGELVLHCGPSICGRCYEVSPDVYARLTGRQVEQPTPVDLRALIARVAEGRGVRTVSISDRCTRCHNGDLFSHRAGDAGRQISLIAFTGRRFA